MNKLAPYELLKKIVLGTAPYWGCPSYWRLTDDPECLSDYSVECEECWQRAIAKAEAEVERSS